MMWDSMQTALVFLGLALLLVVNAAGVALVVFQLPGTWLMVLATGVVVWWRDGQEIGKWTLIAAAVLAVVGEVVEVLPSATGAKAAGGSKRGAVLALGGAVIGALLGTVILPIPVIGTILGACVGAAGGSVLGDRLAGRTWKLAIRSGRAAAYGRFWGTILKVAVAVIMWIIVAIAVFAP